ncbi:M15 family metallopeptidase [Psychrobacillus psychrodurans]|uniref:M15 family metallopeptidase n=1 Tax=Psychrobacillus psychrodurans TaxID=126157 RepID=UPI0008E63FC6|nr:M15 family metallopeptidase [Psychrobacillus psychrodurans]MCZ8541148.1 M15 family metallopeptidase [Psychrobacillus psychrodurans]SFM87070.1 D-alanyl-D-alanine carboxypeptidase [Psychrobacillus psychrodurans]
MQSRYNLLQEKKKKKWPYIVSGTIAGLLIGVIVVWVGMNQWSIDKSIEELRNLTEGKQTIVVDKTEESIIEEPIVEEPKQDVPVKEEPVIEEVDMSGAKGYVGNEVLPQEPTIVNGVLIASKKYPLPSTYAPGESKEARAAFQEMAAEATLSGYDLIAFSTYRSFDYQTQLYDRYVTNDGQDAADRYSARPGYSEHQTGLAFDIGEQHFEQHFAKESFGETEAGKWVAANAHKYGFIMRYPNGSEKITGYMYEPWHFRYVGEELAVQVYEANVTLEEFLDL